MRTSIAYSPLLKAMIINSDGPMEKVRMWLSDEQANGGWSGVVAVRLPRSVKYDRFRNTLVRR